MGHERGDDTVITQAVLAAVKCGIGLEAHLRGKRLYIVGGDIGRVADDKIERSFKRACKLDIIVLVERIKASDRNVFAIGKVLFGIGERLA